MVTNANISPKMVNSRHVVGMQKKNSRRSVVIHNIFKEYSLFSNGCCSVSCFLMEIFLTKKGYGAFCLPSLQHGCTKAKLLRDLANGPNVKGK